MWLQCCQRNHRANDALHLAIYEILDEDSVNISGVARKIIQEYGINITKEKLA